ncbi:MAG: nucleoside-diphosphate sugar epimerase/dehydratase [Mariprofundaceae bacterium]|nr:nucleoside-diphosphate sugar epimerase/dehydratase [Mariprofundaceae bacterium]
MAVFLSYWTRFNFSDIPLMYENSLFSFMMWVIPIQVCCFFWFKLYRGLWYFTSILDFIKIIRTVMLGALLTFVAMFVVSRLEGVPRAVVVLYPLFLIIGLTFPRILYRWYHDHVRNQGSLNRSSVLLIGAGRAADLLLRDMLKGSGYFPIGLLDDDISKYGKEIHGIRVLGDIDQLESCIADIDIDMVVFSIPTASSELRNKILTVCSRLHMKLLVLPDLQQLADGTVKTSTLREAKIEDLLGRNSVVPQEALLCACITGKSVMVTGAGGSIGSELCRQIILHEPKRLILFELNELALYQIEKELSELLSCFLKSKIQILPILGSVINTKFIEHVCCTFQVNTIYHAAAYKHVPLVEWNSLAAIQNNVMGTLHVAQAAVSSSVETFVLVSTDKAVRPTNIMGATKRFAELILQALNTQPNSTRFCMVRFGNVLGSSGSVIPLFRQQIKRGGPITVTDSRMTRYFMTIPEAAQLVLQASSMGKGGDVFVLDMGESVRILDLAYKMIHLSGLSVKNSKNPKGDIAIAISGLRPGEKLYEELLIGDHVDTTQHPLIMCANEDFLEWDILQDILLKLELAVDHSDVVCVKEILLDVIHGYQPKGDIQDLIWIEKNNKSFD